MPRVSVILPAYNVEAYISAAVESILTQTFEDLELIVVEDGSTDATADILRSIHDERLRVIHQENQGMIGALHVAIAAAKSPLLVRMDGDDESLPERIATQVDVLDTLPEVVAVGSSYQVLDPEDRLVWTQAVLTEDRDLRDELLTRSPYAGGSVTMRADAFRAAGDMLQLSCEDFDLWVRLASVGQLAAVPDVLYRWRMNPVGRGSSELSQMVLDAQPIWHRLWREAPPEVRGPRELHRRSAYYRSLGDDLGKLLRDRYLGMVATLATEMRARRMSKQSFRQRLALAAHSPSSAGMPIARARSDRSVATMTAFLAQRRLVRHRPQVATLRRASGGLLP